MEHAEVLHLRSSRARPASVADSERVSTIRFGLTKRFDENNRPLLICTAEPACAV